MDSNEVSLSIEVVTHLTSPKIFVVLTQTRFLYRSSRRRTQKSPLSVMESGLSCAYMF